MRQIEPAQNIPTPGSPEPVLLDDSSAKRFRDRSGQFASSKSLVLPMAEKTYTTTEAAAMIGISPVALYTWIADGKIAAPEAIKTGKRSMLLWTKDDIDRAPKRKAQAKQLRYRLGQFALDSSQSTPKNLDEWLFTQTRFRSWSQLARALGVNCQAVLSWRQGTKPPNYEHRRALFDITKLGYGPASEAKFDSVLDAATAWSLSVGLIPNSRTRFNTYLIRCFRNLANNGISNPEGITPRALARHRHTCSRERERALLTLAGKFFVEQGLWQPADLVALRAEVEKLPLKGTPKPHRKRTPQGIPLLADLVLRNGLSCNEVRLLPFPHVERDGLRFSDELFVPFGDGMHQVRRDAFELWTAQRRPSAFLFSKPLESASYKTSRLEPMGRQRLYEHFLATPGVAQATRGLPYHMQHFEEEFRRNPNPRWMRIHLQHSHGLGPYRSRTLTIKLQRKIGAHLPVPYLLATAAISRALPCDPQNLTGRCSSFTWENLEGYELTVKWPRRFEVRLGRDSRVGAGVARTLIGLGLQAWDEQHKCIGTGWVEDRRLCKQLSKVHVKVRQIATGNAWSGNVINPRPFLVRPENRVPGKRRHGHSRYFDFPLLESLQGGPTNTRCAICCNPNRRLIDDQIRSGGRRPDLVIRFQLDSKCSHSVARDRLRLHALRHVAEAPSAPVVRMPDRFLKECARDNLQNLAAKILGICGDQTALLPYHR